MNCECCSDDEKENSSCCALAAAADEFLFRNSLRLFAVICFGGFLVETNIYGTRTVGVIITTTTSIILMIPVLISVLEDL